MGDIGDTIQEIAWYRAQWLELKALDRANSFALWFWMW
jgi:hypothetical protein